MKSERSEIPRSHLLQHFAGALRSRHQLAERSCGAFEPRQHFWRGDDHFRVDGRRNPGHTRLTFLCRNCASDTNDRTRKTERLRRRLQRQSCTNDPYGRLGVTLLECEERAKALRLTIGLDRRWRYSEQVGCILEPSSVEEERDFKIP